MDPPPLLHPPPRVMWIFGRRPLEEALKAGRAIETVWVAEGARLPLDWLQEIQSRGIPLQRVPRSRIDRLAGHARHGGIAFRLAAVRLADAWKIAEHTLATSGFAVFLDRVQDPQNVGNIVRSAYLLGAIGVVLSEHKTAPLSDAMVRASVGAAFYLPIARVSSPIAFLTRFQKAGGYVVAVEIGGQAIDRITLPFPVFLVLGSEDLGVRRSILKHADLIVTIPIQGQVNSLNVASAAAIALFKAQTDWRQRHEQT